MAINYTISPNMNLIVPTVGQELGPTWAQDLNTNFATLIDQHDHSTGHGVQITPNGLNMTSSLPMQGNSLLNTLSVTFNNPTSSKPSSLLAIYAYQGELYYNDNSGAQVQITSNGQVVGPGGSITGMNGTTALASYSDISKTFSWTSATNTYAFMDVGPVRIYDNNVTTTPGYVEIRPTTPFLDTNSYIITLPAQKPAVESFLSMDNTGQIYDHWTVDNNTIKIVANQLTANGAAIVIPNISREHSWELNGAYPGLSYPLNNIDSIFFAPYNIVINSVWIYSGTAGSGGTTEFDLKVASSGGAFSSILSTTGKITSVAASGVWTDSGSIIGAQTGVTKPALSTTAISAGQAIRFDLLSSMTGSAADARIRIFYTQA